MRRILRGLGWLLGALVGVALLYNIMVATSVLWWKTHDPGMTSFMRRSLSDLQAQNPRAQLRHQWVPYQAISTSLKRAVVAAEDDKFLEHEGFDWERIEKAQTQNATRGKTVAGASTISQQLAKNLFLTPNRSWVRKGEEAIITVMIETFWDKARILEVYLNVVEWGEGVFGCEAAAQHYYGRTAAALNDEQAAHLAVMLPNPVKYEKNYPPKLLKHAERVRRRMNVSEIPE